MHFYLHQQQSGGDSKPVHRQRQHLEWMETESMDAIGVYMYYKSANQRTSIALIKKYLSGKLI